MRISKISRNRLVTMASLFTIPLFSYVFVLIEIVNRKKYAIYALAFVMAIFSIYVLPVADLFRHTLEYYELKDLELKFFLEYLHRCPDFIFYVVTYVFGRLGINFELVRFLSVFVGYSIYFWIFTNYSKRAFFANRREYLYVFFAFFFYIPFFDLSGGIRFYLATAILSCSFYYIYVLDDIRKGVLLGVLACLTHFGQIPILLLMLFLRNSVLLRFKYISLLVSIVLVFAGESWITYLVEISPVPDVYKAKLLVYTDILSGDDGENSFFTLVYVFLSKRLLLFMSILYILRSKVESTIMNLSIGLLLVICLLSAFPISARYISFFCFVVFVSYLELDFKSNNNRWYFKSFFFCYLVLFFLNFYYWRKLLPNDRISEFLLSPTVTSLFHSDDLNTVLLNVDEEGTLLRSF